MISKTELLAIVVLIFVCANFLVYNFSQKRRMRLVQKLYTALTVVVLIWLFALLGMCFSNQNNTTIMYIWDSLTYIGVGFAPVFMLQITMGFCSSREKMPKTWILLYVVPVLTNLIVWTNPLHHFHYKVFSVIRSELVFGPYIFISGGYTYLCIIASAILLTIFSGKNNRLHKKQALMLAIGTLVPLAVSVSATFLTTGMSIAATPLSFMVTLLTNYIAIYRLHMLDVVPVATKRVLDLISDGYMMLNEDGLVIDINEPFRKAFGKSFGIVENRNILDCTAEDVDASKAAISHLISCLNNCAETRAPVVYEQTISVIDKNSLVNTQKHYMVEVTPLEINKQFSGEIVIFKDVTQVKKSMQQLQEGQARLMEQERLALLGQMVGGMAHNLKTPIMSISGCASSIEQLVREAEESIGDEEVTAEDFMEIYGEMSTWVAKIRQSCSYMSDIITAIKEQAANASAMEEREFTIDELLKRVTLLMRHELLASGCQLVQVNENCPRITLRGDINNVVQVLNNLISNAIDAEKESQTKIIYIDTKVENNELIIEVKDTGNGISERVKSRIFQEMVTSKGTKGTGLGLYISNSVIRGKFGGRMWAENCPDGGAVIGFAIPVNTEAGRARVL